MMGNTIAIAVKHGLGDVLMTLPLLKRCDARLGPGDTLIVLIKTAREAELLGMVPWRSRLEVWPLSGRGAGRVPLLRLALALRARRPDVLLAPHASSRPGMAVWSRVVGARIAVGPEGPWSRLGFTATVREEAGLHKVDYFVRFAEAAGFPAAGPPDVTLPIPEDLRAEARARMPGWDPGQRWVLLAPGSGPDESHKRWPPDRFRILAAHLLDASPAIRIGAFGSPGERALLEMIVRGSGLDARRCAVFAEADLGAALAVVAESHCLVSACAGPSHMAAAVDIPIVGLYGPTNPGFTGPYSRRLRVVRLGLGCSPCYRQEFRSGCGHPICMAAIEPGRALREVLAALDGAPASAPPWLATTGATRPDAVAMARLSEVLEWPEPVAQPVATE